MQLRKSKWENKVWSVMMWTKKLRMQIKSQLWNAMFKSVIACLHFEKFWQKYIFCGRFFLHSYGNVNVFCPLKWYYTTTFVKSFHAQNKYGRWKWRDWCKFQSKSTNPRCPFMGVYIVQTSMWWGNAADLVLKEGLPFNTHSYCRNTWPN